MNWYSQSQDRKSNFSLAIRFAYLSTLGSQADLSCDYDLKSQNIAFKSVKDFVLVLI